MFCRKQSRAKIHICRTTLHLPGEEAATHAGNIPVLIKQEK